MGNNKNNIILIGMPGCGKSTVGVVLAKVTGYQFIDSDLLIQKKERHLLSEIIKECGYDGFNRIENEVNTSIETERSVIATGGSAIYGEEAMLHFRDIGLVIYIRLPYEEIHDRLGDLVERGISMKEGQSLQELFEERAPLYEKYAHIITDTQGLTIRESVFFIMEKISSYRKKGEAEI